MRSRFSFGRSWRGASISPRRRPEELERLSVALGLEILVEESGEDRIRGRDAREQGRARFELHVVGRAEDLACGPTFDGQGRLGALDEPTPEQGVIEVGPGLVGGLDRV